MLSNCRLIHAFVCVCVSISVSVSVPACKITYLYFHFWQSGKGVIVKAVAVIDASADTAFEVLLNLERHQRYE